MPKLEIEEFPKREHVASGYAEGSELHNSYCAGLDCARNGANENNSHYTWFYREENTRAWEHGKKDGESERQEAEAAADSYNPDDFPLPKWAVKRSDGNYLEIGAQLSTRDGRRVGNAFVRSFCELEPGVEWAEVVTDAGSELSFNLSDLESLFHPPEYVMDRDEAISKFLGPVLGPDKLYVVLWEDRHCDVTAHPFTDPDDAIAAAKAAAKEYAARNNCEVVEQQIAGWLYYAKYSEEDSIRVVACNFNQPLV